MSHLKELDNHIGRSRMLAIAMLMGSTIAVGANAQQTTRGSAGLRAKPCVAAPANGAVPPVATGVASRTANGEVATTSTTGATAPTTAATATQATEATRGTPTGPGTTAGVAASPPPNNTSTNPDQRFKGLNATNGASGVGADTTTTGKRVPPIADQLPADSARSATVCAPTTGSTTPPT